MRLAWLVVLAACGDNLAPTGRFEIVGHADLGARGMNSALALAGDVAYVGSRDDAHGVAIVDISDPAQPTVVGELGPPDEGLTGMSSRELRAVPDLNLLVVLNLQCSPDLHGCAPSAAEGENLKLYDITDRRAPRLVATYPVHGGRLQPRSPHEMFLYRDGARVLLYVTTPPGPPSLDVVDISDPARPASLVQWDAIKDGGLAGPGGGNNILHSIGASADGRTAFLSHQTDGLALADLGGTLDTGAAPQLITPPAQVLKWPGMGPHSAVQAPGRPLLVVTEEIYPMPFGSGCPWGHLRTVDISDPTAPRVAGESQLAENDPAFCASAAPYTAFTAHNATVLPDLALVTWYAGGLEAIDISDPAQPAQLAELRPEPLPAVEHEDPGLGGNPVEMWSYPVIANGLVYVVDVRNGLYVVRYRGLWANEVAGETFREGNSNLTGS
ncbi:MAG: LVIVD repeat-containing protein [Acidobacteriota bacterium]